jgi:hypothetical protein
MEISSIKMLLARRIRSTVRTRVTADIVRLDRAIFFGSVSVRDCSCVPLDKHEEPYNTRGFLVWEAFCLVQ